jgi:nucleoside-diphosphate-sugar epimerase
VLGDRVSLRMHAPALVARAPDVVLDTRAMTEDDARDLVDTFEGTRLVVLSSADVYRAHGRIWRHEPGPPEPVPFAEDAPLRERLFPYREEPDVGAPAGYDKILVERIVLRQTGATVLRLPAVYGEHDYQHRIDQVLAPMRDGRVLIPVDEAQASWRWTRGHVDDVALAIALAIEHRDTASRAFNVGEPEALTERAWIEAVGRAAGWSGSVVPVPRDRLPKAMADEAARFDFRQDWILDTHRIRTELGFREEATRDARLDATVAWCDRHPPPKDALQKRDYAAEDEALRTSSSAIGPWP